MLSERRISSPGDGWAAASVTSGRSLSCLGASGSAGLSWSQILAAGVLATYLTWPGPASESGCQGHQSQRRVFYSARLQRTGTKIATGSLALSWPVGT